MNTLIQKIPTAARIALGLIFFVFGLNGFFGFLPTPAMPDPAMSFLGALGATGYMFPFIKGIEVLVGAALLSNRFVPLALVMVTPIALNIALFHFVLAPAPAMPLLILALIGYLAWTHRDAYRSVVAMHAAPTNASANATNTGRLASVSR